MCGIAGYFITGSSFQAPEGLLIAMSDAIRHRGPDDEGYLFVRRRTSQCMQFSGDSSPDEVRAAMDSIDEAAGREFIGSADLGLAHRRFSIIAPTPDGHQPFLDAAHRVALIFNGEIYNYVELRDELRALGRVFLTSGDTEVFVQAYLEWGERCFERFNGMWAAALYDFERRRLLLCRDRTGERPLYWVRRPEGIWFASEIRALLAAPGVIEARESDDFAALNFLHQAAADLDRRTFFRGVESLPAAAVVSIDDDGRIAQRIYWRAPAERKEPELRPIGDLCEQLRELLRDSVRLRLRADVPVNVALSGGMDSSSVTAMAAGIKGAGLNTYTVRFREREWNEWPYAAMVVERYGVDNFAVDPQDGWVWDYMESFVEVMEEPFHAPDLLPDHAVRRMLAAQGIRVSLSGIGGDEIFAGYEHYRQFRILDLKREGRRGAALRQLVFASHHTPFEGAARLVRGKLRTLAGRDGAEANSEFWHGAFAFSDRSLLRELPTGCEERLYADVDWALLPYWLRAGDKSSMAAPIEVRFPFLDHRLIEFGMRLPVGLLIRGGWMKWILRKAMEDLLPREVTWRRRKMGFPFPIREWLRGATGRLRPIFAGMDNAYLARGFWREHLDEMIEFDPWLVWRALSFELWHRRFVRGLPVLPESVAEWKRDGREITE
ncbi:MAG: asparagine synthase (glutamine-hydrolyzing) [Acidobacteria bacterium]|nr:asparagine synthase (glutamine-hydrolyzing) [Acidobacteriota bacterium]